MVVVVVIRRPPHRTELNCHCCCWGFGKHSADRSHEKKQKINPDTEKVELVPDSSSPSSIPELVRAISPSEPRFTFYRFAHEHDGGQTSAPLLFIYTCPATQTGRKAIKDRMLYPLMKRAVLDMAAGECGLAIDKKFEVEEPGEITEESVLSDLHPKVEVKKAFSRPKRPGR